MTDTLVQILSHIPIWMWQVLFFELLVVVPAGIAVWTVTFILNMLLRREDIKLRKLELEMREREK